MRNENTMNTYTSNQVKARDQWTVKRQGSQAVAQIKLFIMGAGLISAVVAIVAHFGGLI